MAIRYRKWRIDNFSGLNNKIDDNLIEAHEASDLQNVIVDQLGTVKNRNGYSKLNFSELGGPIKGLYSFYRGATKKIIAASNGVVAAWNSGTSAFDNVKTGLDTGAKVNFETTVQYLVGFNGVDAPWKWDGTTTSALTNAPSGKLCRLHKEKLFTVTETDLTGDWSRLRWSDSFAPETWQAVNYWDVEQGNGDNITGLITFLGHLYIFKRYSTHRLTGTSIDDFDIDAISDSFGAVSQESIVYHHPYLYFVADDGIYQFDGYNGVNLIENLIPETWANINKEYITGAAAGYWDDKIWFALPEDDSTYNDLILCYDLHMKRFYIFRGINASCFATFDDGTGQLFYSGDSNSGFVYQQDIGNTDAGTTITSYWVTKAFDFGAERKNLFHIIYALDAPGANNMQVLYKKDYASTFSTLSQSGGDSLMRRFIFPGGAKGRYLQLKFLHDTSGEGFELRGVVIEYLPLREGL